MRMRLPKSLDGNKAANMLPREKGRRISLVVWDKLIGEYATTGRVRTCPLCGAISGLRTEGTICGERGDVDIDCHRCGARWHYDGSADMHANADPATVRTIAPQDRQKESVSKKTSRFRVEYIGDRPSSRFVKGEVYVAAPSYTSNLVPSYCIHASNGRSIVAAASLFRKLDD